MYIFTKNNCHYKEYLSFRRKPESNSEEITLCLKKKKKKEAVVRPTGADAVVSKNCWLSLCWGFYFLPPVYGSLNANAIRVAIFALLAALTRRNSRFDMHKHIRYA